MDDTVSKTCIKKLNRDTRIDVHEPPVKWFGITDIALQKNGDKARAGWLRDENRVIETVTNVGTKKYSVACIVGVVDALIGIVEFHAIELEQCVLE